MEQKLYIEVLKYLYKSGYNEILNYKHHTKTLAERVDFIASLDVYEKIVRKMIKNHILILHHHKDALVPMYNVNQKRLKTALRKEKLLIIKKEEQMYRELVNILLKKVKGEYLSHVILDEIVSSLLKRYYTYTNKSSINLLKTLSDNKIILLDPKTWAFTFYRKNAIKELRKEKLKLLLNE